MSGTRVKRKQESLSTTAVPTVKFNVGGKLYEVSKSLLEGFPDTMLAEKASSSESSPIFIDRDPDRFAFCLDYMRDDGTVHLPETVTKLAFLKELEFFGFANVDATKICDEKAKQNCMARSNQIIEATNLRIANLEQDLVKRKVLEIEMEKFALHCRTQSATSKTFQVCYPLKTPSLNGSNMHTDPYFIGCCEKLALQVIRGDQYGVTVRRKTSSTLQK